MKTLALASATLALAFTASPALATSGDVPTRSVSYADLNLNTAEGQERLALRIEAAAQNVCSAHKERVGSRIPSPELKPCLANARASAKKQMAAVVAEQRRGG